MNNAEANPSPDSPPSSTPERKRPGKARRLFLYLGVLVVLAGLFYSEENWRGQRVWEDCKSILEAKGQVLEWDNYLPAPVRDDNNIFKAPHMQEWFVGRGANDLSKRLGDLRPKADLLTVAEVTVMTPEASPMAGTGEPDLTLPFADLGQACPPRAALSNLLQHTLGPVVSAPVGELVLLRRPDQIKPARMVITSTKTLATNELQKAMTDPIRGLLPNNYVGELRVEAAGDHAFRIRLTKTINAADFLAATDALLPDLESIWTALQRPQVRMAGNYEEPFNIPIPNFVTVRNLVQLLGERAQCHLLLGEPRKALDELTLIHESRHLLENKPVTLVAAMIHVAISGLYVSLVADGLRQQAWGDPELAVLQRQLTEIDLLGPVAAALQGEPAAVCRTFENMSARDFAKVFGGKKPAWWDTSVLLYLAMPRGWVYQNMAVVAEREQDAIESLSAKRGQVFPQKARSSIQNLDAMMSHFSPFHILASIAMPNFSRALQTTAHNLTLVHQASIVCALERYHLAQGRYPESLEALVPQFMPAVPHDVIGGQPLKYQRTEGGKFLLYSVGWNEKDDAGVPGKSVEEGDWVWGLN